MSIFPRAVVFAAAVPPTLAIFLVLAIAGAERTGATLFADVAPANLAEAAAAGRGDDVVRRLRRGEPLHRVYPMRSEATHSPVARATPASAAVLSRQVLMVQLLDRAGAIAPGDRRELACLAVRLDLPDIAEYLAQGADSCGE